RTCTNGTRTRSVSSLTRLRTTRRRRYQSISRFQLTTDVWKIGPNRSWCHQMLSDFGCDENQTRHEVALWNTWLSSGRRETGLKVHILFAPHFSLQIFGDVRESIEKRARARDLRSRTDPENRCGGVNRKNPAKPIHTQIW